LRRHPRLEQRCFSPAEREYCNSRRRPGQHFAARFAAKEAVAKALQVPVRWREIEIVGTGGPPGVALSGRTLAAAAGRTVLISMSHSRDIAVAAAVTRGDER
jgi:phosphopantetheine--protein transferase-like protein